MTIVTVKMTIVPTKRRFPNAHRELRIEFDWWAVPTRTLIRCLKTGQASSENKITKWFDAGDEKIRLSSSFKSMANESA